MVFYAPFVIALIALVIYRIRSLEINIKNGFSSKEFYMLTLALLAATASCIGYIINSRILSKYYSFRLFNDNQIFGGSVLESLKNYIWSFGYNEEVSLIFFEGIAVMTGVIIGLLTLVSGYRLLHDFKSLTLFEQVLVSVLCSSIAFCVFIFSYVGGEMQYYQPILPFGLFLVIVDICNERYVLEKSKSVVIALSCGMLMLTSLGTTLSEFNDSLHPDRTKPHMKEVVSYLLDSGYNKGVAFFWQSNIITELSNGKIEMWNLEVENGKYQVHEWLQKRDHADYFPQDHYFFIVENGKNIDSYSEIDPELELIYSTAYCDIYGK